MAPTTLEELDSLRDECKKMVMKRAGLSAGAAVVPIIGLDIGADMSLLLEMIPAINRKFGLTPEQIDQLDPQVKHVTLVAITSIGSEAIGKVITKQVIMRILRGLGTRVATKTATRFIPILGQMLAASMSFSAMKMVGDAHVDDCYEVARRTLQPATPNTPAKPKRIRKPTTPRVKKSPTIEVITETGPVKAPLV